MVFNEGELFLDDCDFSGSTASVLVTSGDGSNTTIRNAVLGDKNCEHSREPACVCESVCVCVYVCVASLSLVRRPADLSQSEALTVLQHHFKGSDHVYGMEVRT